MLASVDGFFHSFYGGIWWLIQLSVYSVSFFPSNALIGTATLTCRSHQYDDVDDDCAVRVLTRELCHGFRHQGCSGARRRRVRRPGLGRGSGPRPRGFPVEGSRLQLRVFKPEGWGRSWELWELLGTPEAKPSASSSNHLTSQLV